MVKYFSQILIRTDFADSTTANSKSSAFRTQFHHYNTHGVRGTYDDKYRYLLKKFKIMYTHGIRELGEPDRYKDFYLSSNVLSGVKHMMEGIGVIDGYMESIRNKADEDIEDSYIINSELVPEAGNLRVQSQLPKDNHYLGF